jgi:hypothetical protein
VGFFDKNAAEDAMKAQQAAMQQAAAAYPGMQGAMAGMGNVDMAEMMAYRDRTTRINANGVEGAATILAVRNLGPGTAGVGTKMEFDLSVTAGPGSPRNITIKQEMMGDQSAYTPGSGLTIKINPENPDEALVWGGAPAAGAATAAPASAQPASGGDTVAQLEKLGKLHDSGALTDEEFAQQKARILGG